MNPADILRLATFAAQLAEQAAKAVSEIREQIKGSSTKTVDQILDEGDATYKKIIANAKKV